MGVPLITNDTVVFGLPVLVLGVIFYTKSRAGWWDNHSSSKAFSP